jgi:hypothetical protein
MSLDVRLRVTQRDQQFGEMETDIVDVLLTDWSITVC